MPFVTVNPLNQNMIKTYPEQTLAEVQQSVARLNLLWQDWRKASFADRSTVLLQWAQALDECKEDFAQRMALEMGKPVRQGRSEVEKCTRTLRVVAEKGPIWLASVATESPYQRALLRYEPMGLIFAIMPWNFPLWQFIRFAGPALMAGNVALMKHSELTAGVAELIAKTSPVFKGQALIENARLQHSEAAEVIGWPQIRAVTFTGSTRGGRQVGARAAECLKKSVLELGGSDPYVILRDADITLAAKICANARMNNAGQSCVAAKRFIVESAVAEEFIAGLSLEMAKYRPSDPLKEDCVLGPLASLRFRQQVEAQIHEAIQRGAKLRLSSGPYEKSAAFVGPTVLVYENELRFSKIEEIFGPVACVFIVQNQEEALSVANHSDYGLGCAVFSQDTQRASEFARFMDAGMVAINEQVRSDVDLPFGGVKDSGFGKELGAAGIHEFCNLQSVGWGPFR